MTPRQITRKLEAASYNMNNVVEIGRDRVEVMVTDRDGDVLIAATERAWRKVRKILGVTWGGYRTGYGSWVADANATPFRLYSAR